MECGATSLGMPNWQGLVRIPEGVKVHVECVLLMGCPVCSVKTFCGDLSASLGPLRLPVHLFSQPVPRIMVQSAFPDVGTPRMVEVS